MDEKLKQIKSSALQEIDEKEPESPFEHGMVQFQVAEKVSQSKEGKQQIGMFSTDSNMGKSSIPLHKKAIHGATPFDSPPPGHSNNPSSSAALASGKEAPNAAADDGQRTGIDWKLVQQMGSSLEDILSIVKRGGSQSSGTGTQGSMSTCANNSKEGLMEQKSNESISSVAPRSEAKDQR